MNAKRRMRDKQFAEAILQLQKVLVTKPDSQEAIFLLAQCEAKQGRFTRALELLDQVTPSDPTLYSDASWLAADLFSKLQRFDEAVARLESLAQVSPSIKMHRLLAMLLNQLGRRREAGLHLNELAKAGDITEEELFQMNAFSQPIVAHGGLMLDESKPLTADALNEAKRERIEGNLNRSRDLAQRLVVLFPQSPAITAFYCQTLADLEEFECLSQAIAKLPAKVELESEYWYAMAKWADRQGKYEQAVRCCLENLLIDPTDRDAYRSLAHALRALGREAEAKVVTDRYLLLQDVYLRTVRLGTNPGTLKDVDELAAKLDLLQRPFEALAWRKAGANGRGRSLAELATLEKQRMELVKQDAKASSEFIACGLRVADWPAPERYPDKIVSLQTDSSLLEDTKRPLELIDVARQSGLDFRYDNGDPQGDAYWYIYQISGGGVGVIDFDLDGWQDIYFSQAGSQPWTTDGCGPNQLFRNLNGRRFTSVAEPSATDDRGYGQGVAVADLNQDGFQDLVVANIGLNQLYINRGDGTFKRQSMPADSEAGDWTCSIVCGDLSRDGLPEIVEVNYIADGRAFKQRCAPNNQNCNPASYQAAQSLVWSVSEVGEAKSWDGCAGLAGTKSYGFAAVIANLDSRVGNELFVANDTTENFLWSAPITAGEDSRAFKLYESASLAGCAVGWLGQRQGSMGIAVGDFDRDSRADLHVTNYWNQPADLFLQKSDSLFTNATMSYGLYEPSRLTVGWGTQAVDLDRDGWLDLAVLNGHVLDRREVGIPLEMKPQLFKGSNGRFQLVSDEALVGDYWGKPSQGRTLATVDYNRDGKPDFVASHLDEPVALLENRTNSQHFLRVKLVGTHCERDAMGAQVTVSAGEQTWTGWMTAGGFACSNESVVDFGVGNQQQIDKIEVVWPSGHRQTWDTLNADETYQLTENESEAFHFHMQSQ